MQPGFKHNDALVCLHDFLYQLERRQLLGKDREQTACWVLAVQRLVVNRDPDSDILAERREN
jgi:hypothetical protein